MIEAILRKIKGKEKITSGNQGELVRAIHEGDIQSGDLIEINDDLALLFEYLPKNERVTGWTFIKTRVTGDYDQWTYKSGEWRGKTHSRWGDRSDLVAERDMKKPALFGYLKGDYYTCLTIRDDGFGYSRSFGERFMGSAEVQIWKNLGPLTLEENNDRWNEQQQKTLEEVK